MIQPHYLIPLILHSIVFYFATKTCKTYVFKKNRVFHLKNKLPFIPISLYVFSSLLMLIAKPDIWYESYNPEAYTAINFFLYGLITFVFLIPVLYLKPLKTIYELPSGKILNSLIYMSSIAGIFAVFYFVPYAVQGVSADAALTRANMAEGNYILPQNNMTTLAVAIAYFYIFFIVLFFTSITLRKNVILSLSLLVGSFSYFLYGLSFATRDVFVFYPISFVFVYYYFINVLTDKHKFYTKLSILTFLVVSLTFITLISFERMGGGDLDYLLYGTLGYISQQPFTFSQVVEYNDYFTMGDRGFSLFKSFFFVVDELPGKVNEFQWNFGTFASSFYLEGGWELVFLMTTISLIVFLFLFTNIEKLNFYQKSISMMFYFQFIMQGIFYFKMGSPAGNMYMIILFVLFVLSSIKFNRRKVCNSL